MIKVTYCARVYACSHICVFMYSIGQNMNNLPSKDVHVLYILKLVVIQGMMSAATGINLCFRPAIRFFYKSDSATNAGSLPFPGLSCPTKELRIAAGFTG